ncbi:MAG: hypothetical protein Q8P51_10525 [Ignavibacteria bacterium]|nr:hypothetical protein [Ignavibacteria bacterium]
MQIRNYLIVGADPDQKTIGTLKTATAPPGLYSASQAVLAIELWVQIRNYLIVGADPDQSFDSLRSLRRSGRPPAPGVPIVAGRLKITATRMLQWSRKRLTVEQFIQLEFSATASL